MQTGSEIQTAADFFEKHQAMLETMPEEGWNPIGWLPYTMLYGHQKGNHRAARLRRLAEALKLSGMR